MKSLGCLSFIRRLSFLIPEEADLPPAPKFAESTPLPHHRGARPISGEFQLPRPFLLGS
jgi:hypothetical protein